MKSSLNLPLVMVKSEVPPRPWRVYQDLMDQMKPYFRTVIGWKLGLKYVDVELYATTDLV